ncbi:O-methyltransferase [Tepidimicrobium xylanilyticum]|uniref:tRNA 5-hydroxyuridine methyltransferase n=1 Tax=Tepidimicrobium xylanilyticum TaxID=1123352 RepID=A0A1H2SI36_9FIRM|nr:O-methyltransferase [Tepidimicrobium xylanilyticum]GMG96211.1 O-methyltransferase [Tepidimicrobium xylanilyticum]SDW31125.1 Predicted O-methyltransferase YrrM [Tepidimicrobium xylanilyticum]
MSQINEEYIEEYIRNIIPSHKGILKELEEYAMKNHIPIIEREVTQLLKVILKVLNPKSILEIGTAIGYSALVMASSTNEDCLITTIERRSDMVKEAEENFKKTKYKDRIRILQGEAEELLPTLNDKYDFIFLDAAKGQYLQFFNDCKRILNNKGIIMSDNVLFKGMVASDDLVVRRKKTIVKRLRKYLEYINNIEGYESCILPIGDGVALTFREE